MNKKFKILVVEDEAAIRDGLIDVLVYHGYEVEAVGDGGEGLSRALNSRFDLVLLDVMLPTKNGFEICDAIRQHDRELAVIMLTAKGSEDDIINGLKLGADDYMAKPFSITELILRIEAILRRTKSARKLASTLTISERLSIDTNNLCGTCDDQEISFTRREVDILQYLYAHRERAVSRDELLSEVWGYAKHVDIETRTVDIHMAKLRRKIEQDPKLPTRLVTIRGAGYRLNVGDDANA